jgi:LysR family transcriptional regulator, nitrogen assimilation regulatory protein
MLTLRQIRSFVAVYEETSFTAAAAREGATQSGISQHIRQLEAELKVPLFVRDGRNVEPTTAGRLYYAQCIEVLRRLDTAQQSVTVNRTLGTIRVGLMPTFTRAVLTPTLSRFLEQSPGSEVKIVEAYSGVLTDMILGGELDFAVVPSFEGATGLSHHLLARDREMLVSAGGGKGPALKPVRLAELRPLKIIVPSAQNTRRRNIETYFTANGVQVAQRLELDAMMGTLQFVAASDWVAILPFLMMVGDLSGGRFDIRPLEDPPFYSEFILIQPARKTLTPAATLFADILKDETARARAIFNRRAAVRRRRSR